jgi:Domain of unknown function (DUF4272)
MRCNLSWCAHDVDRIRSAAVDDALDTEDTEPRPPSSEEVARRALVLAVVSCRGILELDVDREGAQRFWVRVSDWWNDRQLDDALEPEEKALLAVPFGSAPRQLAVNASWRSEALAVLAWALCLTELPPHDTQAEPSSIANALGFLAEKTVLDAPRLRSATELNEYANVAFTVHWRVREFTLRPEHLDLVKFCETAWFGPLSLRGVRLHEGDLSVGQLSIDQAPQARVRTVLSIARERHQAINWLLDASSLLSETDTST